MSDSVINRFLRIAEQFPDRPAIVKSEKELTYKELLADVDSLARIIVRKHGSDSEPVAILCSRGRNCLVSMLAILRAGKFMVCLDPSHPSERLCQILQDAQPLFFVFDSTNEPLQKELASQCGIEHRLRIDEIEDSEVTFDVSLPVVNSQSPCCLIYTSGSTGRPKGVLQRHEGIFSEIDRVFTAYGIDHKDRVSHVLSPSVIAGLREIFSSLLYGACLYPYDLKVQGLRGFAELIKNNRITVCRLVPSLVMPLLDSVSFDPQFSNSLKLVYLSGEPTSIQQARNIRSKLCSHGKVVNVFGTSETGTMTLHEIPEDCTELNSIPMGQPASGVSIRLVDEQGFDIPVGQIGRIDVSGTFISSGYWNNIESTDSAFSFHDNGARTFRTGDYARLTNAGIYEYCGRTDDQVQILGNRVELGEIDRQVGELETVITAISKAWKSPAGQSKVATYYQPTKGQSVDVDRLRSHLESTLPMYMIPSFFVEVNHFVRSPSGKILKSELPEPNWQRDELESHAQSEKSELGKIWERHLGLKRVQEDDDFFKAGGDSMTALSMMLEVEKKLGMSFPISILFEARTYAKFRKRVESESNEQTQVICLNEGDGTCPIFLIHPVGCNLLHYYDLVQRLPRNQTVYGIQPLGLRDQEEPIDNLEDMAEHYISLVRSIQPIGPYRLGGSSFGGNVAFEMTSQLECMDEEVSLLALFDSRTRQYLEFSATVSPLQIRLYKLRDRFNAHWWNFWGRNHIAKMRYLLALSNTALDRFRLVILTGRARPKRPLNLRKTAQANWRAIQNHVPKPVRTRISLFRARCQPTGIPNELSLGWQDYALGGIDIYPVDGYHGECCREPHVQSLAPQFQKYLLDK